MWVAAALIGSAAIGAGVSMYSSGQASDDAEDAANTAATATREGAEISAQSQREALAYMKEREAIPRQFSEQGLKRLGGLYDMKGGTGNQQELINKAMQSPLYGAIMGGQQAGEESILRNAAATGGLRSGDVQSNLYDYNTQLRNQALLESYNQQLSGLQGMAGLPNNTTAITGQMSGIGQTLGGGATNAGNILAQGQVASGQAMQQGYQGVIDSVMGATKMGLKYYSYSDRRLKKNIVKVGELEGHNWYTWDWNTVANKMGMVGKSEGVIADEVYRIDQDAVGIRYGFLTVNYEKIGIFNQGGKNA